MFHAEGKYRHNLTPSNVMPKILADLQKALPPVPRANQGSSRLIVPDVDYVMSMVAAIAIPEISTSLLAAGGVAGAEDALPVPSPRGVVVPTSSPGLRPLEVGDDGSNGHVVGAGANGHLEGKRRRVEGP